MERNHGGIPLLANAPKNVILRGCYSSIRLRLLAHSTRQRGLFSKKIDSESVVSECRQGLNPTTVVDTPHCSFTAIASAGSILTIVDGTKDDSLETQIRRLSKACKITCLHPILRWIGLNKERAENKRNPAINDDVRAFDTPPWDESERLMRDQQCPFITFFLSYGNSHAFVSLKTKIKRVE